MLRLQSCTAPPPSPSPLPPPPPAQSPANLARLQALGLQVLRLQRDDQALHERTIRERLGNNPDTSKALRR